MRINLKAKDWRLALIDTLEIINQGYTDTVKTVGGGALI